MGFIVASALLLNETQHRWWQPKPLDIGWHVAFWNLVVRIFLILHYAKKLLSSSTSSVPLLISFPNKTSFLSFRDRVESVELPQGRNRFF